MKEVKRFFFTDQVTAKNVSRTARHLETNGARESMD